MHPTQHTTILRRTSRAEEPAARPPFPRAKDASTHNPTVQQQRITLLVKSAAETLASLGAPQKRVRILNNFTTSDAA